MWKVSKKGKTKIFFLKQHPRNSQNSHDVKSCNKPNKMRKMLPVIKSQIEHFFWYIIFKYTATYLNITYKNWIIIWIAWRSGVRSAYSEWNISPRKIVTNQSTVRRTQQQHSVLQTCFLTWYSVNNTNTPKGEADSHLSGKQETVNTCIYFPCFKYSFVGHNSNIFILLKRSCDAINAKMKDFIGNG